MTQFKSIHSLFCFVLFCFFSIHSLVLSFLYGLEVQLSHPYMTTGKTIALTMSTFVSKVTSLPFNVLSVLCLVTQSCPTLYDPPGSSFHRDSPGKNTGVDCRALLQGTFPIQGLNPGLPHCRQILYWLSHLRSPRILEWVACPFSRGSSWPRNQTGSPALQMDFLPAQLQGKSLVAV